MHTQVIDLPAFFFTHTLSLSLTAMQTHTSPIHSHLSSHGTFFYFFLAESYPHFIELNMRLK